MKKIKQKLILAVLTLTTLFVGCAEPELTGQSNLEVGTGIKVTLTTDFASPVSIIEGDNKYNFTITLDKTQPVDVVVKINQIDGTASSSDYTVDSSITIPAYTLSASAELKILKDDLHEETETLVLQVGDNTISNASIAPVSVTFNIQNYTEGSLITSLQWNTSIDLKDIEGNSISATDAADLKLLITPLDYNTSEALEKIDESIDKFESFEMLASYPDGTYLVVAEAVSFLNLGAQGNFDLDLTVKFNQSGVYNDKEFSFEKVMNSSAMTACGPSGFFKLATITKSGSTYTLAEVDSEVKFNPKASQFNGDYKITLDEWADYSVGDIVPVVYNPSDGTTTFRVKNTNHPYLVNATTSYLLITIDSDATVTVVSNEDYDYGGGDTTSVEGTGTVGFCGSFINLSLDFPGFGESGYKLNLVKN